MVDNYSHFIARITNDPEIKYTPSGIAICTFQIAWNPARSKEHKEAGTWPEGVFIPCKAWKQQAEFTSRYLEKGRQVDIEGHWDQERWTDPSSGEKRSKLILVVDNIQPVEWQSHDDGGYDN